MGCFVAEAFSGTVIEAVRHDGDVIEGHLFWKELADEAVHVFVATVLLLGQCGVSTATSKVVWPNL